MKQHNSMTLNSRLLTLTTTSLIVVAFALPAEAQYTCTDELGRTYTGNTIREIQQIMEAVGAIAQDCEGSSTNAGQNQATSSDINKNPETAPEPSPFGKAVFIDGYLVPPQCLGDAYVGPKGGNSPCDINAVMTVVINISRLILGTIGSAALLMFIYGGVIFLVSSGNSQQVDQGKTIIKNAVIGISITFFAWVGVSTLISAITGSPIGNPLLFGNQSPFTLKSQTTPTNAPAIDNSAPIDFNGPIPPDPSDPLN